jgi:hypothetical protein
MEKPLVQIAFGPSWRRQQNGNSAGRNLVAVLALLCAALISVAPQSSADIPRGVFSLSTSGKPCSDTVLANPDVMGVSIRYGWFELEPTEGDFDWTFLDAEVARIAAAGKQVLLRIGTMSGRPDWVTTAVRRAGGKFFTFDDNGVETSIPVFWDPTFLAKKKALIAAVGKRFTRNPAVAIVTASFANATSEDWNVPHTATDIDNWFDVGYTTARLLDAGEQIIDATMAAFPNQYVALAIGGNGHTGATGNLDPTADYVAENAIATAGESWPGRLIPQINSLSTFNPASPGPEGSIWNLLWNSRPDVGAQMVFWCFDEPTYRVNGGEPGKPAKVLTECVDAAVSYELNYIEIYQKDVINLPTVISYAKSELAR